jgi:threonine dehydrogenase-like Zn-dependent dehydrogenase
VRLDLWYYRGESPHTIGSIGHELIGFVQEVASAVKSIVEGDLVITPFLFSDGTWALSDGRDRELRRRRASAMQEVHHDDVDQ